MNFYETKNSAVELQAEWANFRQGRYPEFVTGKREPTAIPVFSFHTFIPTIFESQLRYLSDNGYRPVKADEYRERGGACSDEKIVMLTFDDGKADLWTVAYPLLKKYGMCGVAFVLPGETPEGDPRKIYNGSAGGGENDELLCTWDELRAMGDVIDVQSHSLYHGIVFTTPEPVAFYNPTIRDRWPRIDRPITHDSNGDNLRRDYPLGTPFYDMEARLSDSPRLFEPIKLREALAAFVASRGGEDFFVSGEWPKLLLAEHERLTDPCLFRVETEEEQSAAIRRCFAESKQLLESRLQKSVEHFCFPFGIGGQQAVRLAVEEGFRVVYYGVQPPPYALAEPGLTVVARVKDDYLYRLPGRGRRSLLAILGGKFARRLGGRFGSSVR